MAHSPPLWALLLSPLLLGGAIPSVLGEDSDSWFPGTDLPVEAHGFVSFGSLNSWGDNWLGQTENGTTRFWEMAANAVARPFDRVRIGAQLYARDLVDYDNGQVQLDWAYVDWRIADAFGVQVGRVKFPLGLYNENIDVDVARASVFMPVSFYSLIDRDLYISIDGIKVYGDIELGRFGSAEYALYAGKKHLRPDGDFATHYSQEYGLGTQVEDISAAWGAGGMAHWNTPVQGLALRVSLADLHQFNVDAFTASDALTTQTRVENYYEGILSTQYEVSQMTFAAEYQRLHGHGDSVISPIDVTLPLIDNGEYAYASATWHARRWLELYSAVEGSWPDAGHFSGIHTYTGVLAFNLMPLNNWSLKAEFRENEGTFDIYPSENPGGLNKHWQVLALKTTVDF